MIIPVMIPMGNGGGGPNSFKEFIVILLIMLFVLYLAVAIIGGFVETVLEDGTVLGNVFKILAIPFRLEWI